MKYCTLGGMQSSKIVMGCMRINSKNLERVEQTIVTAMSMGVNTFDLADVYGDAERTFGVAVRDLTIPRKDFLIQTKCGIRRNANNVCRFDFTKEYILSAAEGNLKRLNTDYIDVFTLHRPDTLIEPDEVAEAFTRLAEQGKVRAFAVSNFTAAQMQLLQSAGVEIAANQIQFSLAHTAPVDGEFFFNLCREENIARAGDVVSYARLHKIPLQAWSPLQYGFFEGSFLGNENYPKLNAALETLANKYAVTPAAIALAWILRHPAFGQVVTGTTSPEHMKELCAAADITLTHEEWYDLYAATGKNLP